jgi:uncharacterized protein YkwD
MKNLLITAFSVFFFLNCTPPKVASSGSDQSNDLPRNEEASADVCLSGVEKELYAGIMAYRNENGLSAIPLSASLSKVAQLHVRDLQENRPAGGRCNLHSWSKAYGDCCYTSDHRRADCMWDKPRELTDYTGNGYEIAHWASDGATAASALQGWKSSSGHNAVMTNKSIWKDVTWNAVGIGIYREYAVVWFGKEADGAGMPGNCD